MATTLQAFGLILDILGVSILAYEAWRKMDQDQAEEINAYRKDNADKSGTFYGLAGYAHDTARGPEWRGQLSDVRKIQLVAGSCLVLTGFLLQLVALFIGKL